MSIYSISLFVISRGTVSKASKINKNNVLFLKLYNKDRYLQALYGTLKFYTPSLSQKENSWTICTEATNLTYYAQDGIELDDPDYGVEIPEYYNFPFVLNKDGSLWADATLYFVWKIKEQPAIASETLAQHASTLQDFKRFCEMKEEEEKDEPEKNRFHYLRAPIKSRRANVMYGRYLRENNAKQWGKKMKFISAFYKYLIRVRKIYFGVDMLETEKANKLIITQRGGFIKEFEYNKVDQEAKTQSQGFDTINDGEKMRPMSMEEQEIFENAIFECKNDELVLGIMIAITSMARKQTVYTLRLKHFVDDLPTSYDEYTLNRWKSEKIRMIKDNDEKAIFVGDGTGIDTKNGKRFNIYIKGWLYKAIINYIASKRATKRRTGALPQNNDLDQYVFLSRDSNPIYHAKNDINLEDWKRSGKASIKGNSIDQGMKRLRDEELMLACAARHANMFPVRFHDLRATGAMRYLDRNESLVDGVNITWGKILLKLAKLLAHESIVTTQRYLDLKLLYQVKMPQLQLEYEIERMTKYRSRDYS